MAKLLTASSIKKKAYELKQYWAARNEEFKDDYKVIRLENELKTDKMESFTSNDPRTLFRLALFLLTPKTIPINIPINNANAVVQAAITDTEQYFSEVWLRLDKQMRRKGKGGWLRYFNALLLTTGWYAIRAIATDDGIDATIWNPAEVFPDYDPDIGLGCVAHIYNTSVSAARKNAADNNWSIKFSDGVDQVEVVDYWYYDETGVVCNAVVMGPGDRFAKPPTQHPEFRRIPIHCSPVGGLPDNGTIEQDPIDWKRNVGSSIISDNKGMYRSYNRQMSFLQQIMRDTAQPRIQVRSKTKGVVNEANWNARGAIYELDTDEDISAIPMPGPPPELSTNLQITEAMIERGGLPFSLYTGQGAASGYQQSLTTANAEESLKDYKDAGSFVLTDICNDWLDQMRNGIRPGGFVLPEALPPTAIFDVELKISIPGDLIQRATTARQLNPTFELSTTRVMDMVFPEVRDPNQEEVFIRRDKALQHPIMASLDLIAALQDQADALEAEGLNRQADLYRQTAQTIQQQMAGTPTIDLPQGYRNYLQGANGGNNPGPPGNANAGYQGQQ